MTTPAALAGIRVLELAEGIAGPFAGRLLAGYGATVVKVERPDGGDRSRGFGPFPDDIVDREKSGLFAYLNAGKQSATLDVDTDDGRQIVHELAGTVAVLLTGETWREQHAIGVTHEQLQDPFPQLIVTSITAFGTRGPLRDVPAQDINFCALGGVTTVVGEADRPPLTPSFELSAYQAGLSAAAATMLALFARRRTGRGQLVDVSPLDAWATVHQGTGLMNALVFGLETQRSGRRRRDAYPFHLIECSDGWMCMIARDGSQWKRFVLEVVGDPVLTEPRFRDRRAMGLEYPDEVDAVLHPWFQSRTRSEIFALCRRHHVPFSPVRTLDEVAACEQLAARGFFVDTPVGADGDTVRMPGAPQRLSATPWVTGAAPRLGEHTASVLAALGAGSAAPLEKVS